MDLGYPGAKELGEKYAADHNGDSSVSIGLSYAAAQVMFQAIANANSTDPTAVRDAVWGQTFTGTTMGDVSTTTRHRHHAGHRNVWLNEATPIFRWSRGQRAARVVRAVDQR
jgi:ABC-type branched-subunit amino acid transport system substrate-binding protein